jgi:hypothetical protein
VHSPNKRGTLTVMSKNRVVAADASVRLARQRVKDAESALQDAVAEVIDSFDGGLRAWAQSMKISAAYACDLKYGRRKVSEAIVAKIAGA